MEPAPLHTHSGPANEKPPSPPGSKPQATHESPALLYSFVSVSSPGTPRYSQGGGTGGGRKGEAGTWEQEWEGAAGGR